ncbi:MAG: DNA polymerase domain-containing protein [Sumerlaeia bacterium]
MNAQGWLFDLYARGRQMVLWFVLADGGRLRLTDPFAPAVYLSGAEADVAACAALLERHGDAEADGWTERRDFWSGSMQPVFAVRPLELDTWRFRLPEYAHEFPLLEWYNADLLPEQLYCYERELFPLMRCEVDYEGTELRRLTSRDDRWAIEYELPPLRTAELSGEGRLQGKRSVLRSLTMECDGRAVTWDEPATILEAFQAALDDADPDVLMTAQGDAFLIPLLLSMARRMRFDLRLGRESAAEERPIRTEGRTYFSYGRVLYQAPEHQLLGRWHLDRANSFAIAHNGLDGLAETVRLSRIPPQRAARRSIGTGITSIQLDMAYREGYLIPWKKTQPEAWKSARQLLTSDRGGLVYAPDPGFHENVVELDYMSMYPSIMAWRNVSPETVNCDCCSNRTVPEIGYTICERRAGLVSRSLAPIIEKRQGFKKLRKAAKENGDKETYDRYHARQDALKWMLVCCFGYLGYRNARFGRIEAHEAVSAYSREGLLVAREVAEAHGWSVLHANVDSVWLKKPGFRDEEIPSLCDAINEASGLTISLEGIYKWVVFLPSRQVQDRPVPTRYFGAFRHGELKYRGIECRRGDLPMFVKKAQLELLHRLAEAEDEKDYIAMCEELNDQIDEWEQQLWRREIPQEDLVMQQSLSQDPEEYRGNGLQALAARQSMAAGLNLHAGESLRYLITSAGDPDRSRRVRLEPLWDFDTTYDPAAYVKLLRRAMNTLLWPTGHQRDEHAIRPPGAPPPAPPRRKRPGHRQLDLLEGFAAL